MLQLTVDSGGVIDDDALQISGVINSDGTGGFTQQSLGLSQCNGESFHISSVSQNGAEKWVIAGTNFSLTQQ
jgi:hypothetical protein